MNSPSNTSFVAGSAFAALTFVAPVHAGPLSTHVTIDLAACERASGNQTLCSSDPVGIPNHTIPGGSPLSIDFSLGSTAPAHLVAFDNAAWIFDLSFCCEEVDPDFALTLFGLNGAIPGFEDIPPDDATACELFGDCTFTLPIPGSTSVNGLSFSALYPQQESVLAAMRITTTGSDHIATVPEPAAGALVLLALAGAGLSRRKV